MPRMIFGLIFVLVCLFVISTQALDCNEVVSQKKSDDLISFLKTRAQQMDAECVSRAITTLGDLRAASGADALASFLDFERPQSERERAGVADPHDKFPAVPALVSIGLPAVPTLMRKLQGGEMTKVARQNAIRSIVLIHSEDPSRAIETLKRAATETRTQEESLRMESSARDAIRFCSKSWRDRCEAALTASNR